jgi:hypothetical protein
LSCTAQTARLRCQLTTKPSLFFIGRLVRQREGDWCKSGVCVWCSADTSNERTCAHMRLTVEYSPLKSCLISLPETLVSSILRQQKSVCSDKRSFALPLLLPYHCLKCLIELFLAQDYNTLTNSTLRQGFMVFLFFFCAQANFPF